jgi:hypothetical protein
MDLYNMEIFFTNAYEFGKAYVFAGMGEPKNPFNFDDAPSTKVKRYGFSLGVQHAKEFREKILHIQNAGVI